MPTIEVYTYTISGYYFSNNEEKYFYKEIEAKDNIEAMKIVIGEIAWNESLEGNTFLLKNIHYD